MERAVLLIDCRNVDELRLTDDGEQAIKNIPGVYDLITLAIVGLARNGKSSLMNKLARKKVFQTGLSMDPVTKGIWIYVDLKHDIKKAIVYLDVEGFGNTARENTDKSDLQILTVVSQLCDVLMYNTRGVFDNEMMKKKLLRKIRLLSKPILVTILRDCQLQLQEDPDAVLEKCIRESNTEKSFEVFRYKKAVVLVTPTAEEVVPDLLEIRPTELREKFVDALKDLEAFLKEKAEPLRSYSNTKISSDVLVEVVRTTVRVVNDSDYIGFSQSMSDIFERQNEKIKECAYKTYKEKLTNDWPDTSSQETLSNVEEKCRHDAFEEMQRKWFSVAGSAEPITEEFKVETNKLYLHLSKEKSTEELKRLSSQIKRDYENEYYFVIGGSDTFRTDMRNLGNSYKQLRNLGSEANNVWLNYESKQTNKVKMIKAREALEETKARDEGKGWGNTFAGVLGGVAVVVLFRLFGK